MKIRNYADLARTEVRRHALAIAEAGLAAIDTELVVRNAVRLERDTLFVCNDSFLLSEKGRLIVIGIGKCGGIAGLVLEEMLGDRLTRGVVVDVRDVMGFKKLTFYKGTHPLPSEDNVRGAHALMETLEGLTEDDVVVFVVSGGGSTLLCVPESGNCEAEVDIVKKLVHGGAPIEDVNTVRKHLSFARGGYLAKYAYPARVVALVFSDVVNGDVGFIASGPTVKDETTVDDAAKVLERYGVLAAGGAGIYGLIETPKEDKYFERVHTILVVTNEMALRAMRDEAVRLGYSAEIRTKNLTGEAREMGGRIVNELHESRQHTALLYGGETTVTLTIFEKAQSPHEALVDSTRGEPADSTGSPRVGKGGRNMELALSALRGVREGEVVLALASDGMDNTDFAGAIVDTGTRDTAKARSLAIEKHLDMHNTYEFFKAVGDQLVTGPTGSNVSDLIVAIKE